MKIVAINASPRTAWNTATLVREAAKGAESEGAEIKIFDLYKSDKFTGCVSCFGCKLPQNLGVCVYKDGLSPVLEEIRTADGLIIGTPNYLGDVSAAFRALYERLIFQSLTYKIEPRSYNEHMIPVLFIMTSNASEEFYDKIGYDRMIDGYRNMLSNMVGPTKVMVYGNTLQVNDYDKYNWTMFDPEEKKKRHDSQFIVQKEKAFSLGVEMIKDPWK
ncbi:MAG: flavodoxin family protein [Anaerofustis stercorihominis]|nr:flavodoxin family protein [Anaerofustis stercorihominis]